MSVRKSLECIAELNDEFCGGSEARMLIGILAVITVRTELQMEARLSGVGFEAMYATFL